MNTMSDEMQDFLSQRAAEQATATQRVALQLLCGLDLKSVFEAGAAAQERALLQIRRLIGRERLRGLSGHWSYDLNRHIALKQVATRLAEALHDRIASDQF